MQEGESRGDHDDGEKHDAEIQVGLVLFAVDGVTDKAKDTTTEKQKREEILELHQEFDVPRRNFRRRQSVFTVLGPVLENSFRAQAVFESTAKVRVQLVLIPGVLDKVHILTESGGALILGRLLAHFDEFLTRVRLRVVTSSFASSASATCDRNVPRRARAESPSVSRLLSRARFIPTIPPSERTRRAVETPPSASSSAPSAQTRQSKTRSLFESDPSPARSTRALDAHRRPTDRRGNFFPTVPASALSPILASRARSRVRHPARWIAPSRAFGQVAPPRANDCTSESSSRARVRGASSRRHAPHRSSPAVERSTHEPARECRADETTRRRRRGRPW